MDQINEIPIIKGLNWPFISIKKLSFETN